MARIVRQASRTSPAHRNAAIQRRQARAIADIRALGYFRSVLQFVGDRRDQPVFDGVDRVDANPDVAIMV